MLNKEVLERFCTFTFRTFVILFSDKLKLKGASEYNFLNQSNSLVIHNVDDAKKFHMLVVSSRNQIG